MKKSITILLLLFGLWWNANSQTKAERLEKVVMLAQNDSQRVELLNNLADVYKFSNPDSAILFANSARIIAKRINDIEQELWSVLLLGLSHITLGNDAEALQNILWCLKVAEEENLMDLKAKSLIQMGIIYTRMGEYEKALNYHKNAGDIFDSIQNHTFSAFTKTHISKSFLYLNRQDSALYYGSQEYNKNLVEEWVNHYYLVNLGKVYQHIGNTKLALAYLRETLENVQTFERLFNSNFALARLYKQENNIDSCIYYAEKTQRIVMESGIHNHIIEVNIFLSEIYETINTEKALQYLKTALLWKEKLDKLGKSTAISSFIEFDDKEKHYQAESIRIEYQNKVQRLWIFSIAGALISALLVAYILFRNNKIKQKINAQLQLQKEEIVIQKNKAESALANLKSTQSQLIQSEKMASLGELTAGIAHEIQNPLNFVNNFSEVSKELAEELKEEAQKPKLDSSLISELAEDIVSNQKKINHHGQRASGIVKGMLEHSRTGDGKKESTDLNALADEYLRLAYHGLRAKDKSFNADFKTQFDVTLPKVNVIPQDIGRVLLNLINNALYAVDKRAKENHKDYKPELIISTKKLDGQIEISVKDNGPGIPKEIQEKIFQPFFTTKQTGSGTGLGLSLSYDIVKAHGGELTVETKEDEGSEFIIHLPIV